jgi:hypothetical protein
MIIGKYIPENARQVRYIHPQYERDENDDEYIWNEDEMTDVEGIIQTVSNDRIPVYYRRRLSDYAREDTRKWNRYINQNNSHQKRIAEDDDDFGGDYLYVRVKKVGRRVLFVYDKQYWDKVLKSTTIKASMNITGRIIKTKSDRERETRRSQRQHDIIRESMDHMIENALDREELERNWGSELTMYRAEDYEER